jgi:radical SAM protein (TIGR01212 family)
MQKLRFFKEYLIEKYGKPLYRIPIDLPLGCPNRDNDFGEGCIYCAEDGNRARHLKHQLDIPRQVSSGIDFAVKRYGAKAPYIAYFQSFTNTYGSAGELKKFYCEALNCADFKMVIIGTRPDCISDEILDLLREIAAKYELWVELGVQTSNDETLKLIRRGHSFAAVKTAAAKLAAAGINCAAHVILGLPGETIDDYRRTARDIAALPFKAVKLHNLLVLKNTPLAKIFADKNAEPPVKPLNEYEYAFAAAEFLRQLPDDLYIMRLNTDAPENELIAPEWWMKKGQFLEFFREYYASGSREAAFQAVETADGSLSLYHPKYRQHFHTLAGARSEAEKKFVEAVDLRRFLREHDCVRLLDVGFGLGYNTLAAVNAAEKLRSGKLKITALENDLQVLKAASGLFPENSLHRTLIESLLDCGSRQSDFAEVNLKSGDARSSITELEDKFDCIFMDGFSPDKNPELWTYDFIRELSKHLAENGLIVTYSSAYPVKGAMLRCGLAVGETDSFGRKRGGTIAAFRENHCFKNLPEKELKIILKSTAGAAYRDPGLHCGGKEILARRKRLISRLRRLGIPKWYKE